MRTKEQWYEILMQCHVKPRLAEIWAPVFAEVIKPESFNLGNEELDDFLGQVLHESMGFTHLSEDLNYSAKRLTEVWPGRFPTVESAAPYAFNPEALANKTYGGRMGNVNEGDGWKYRGRGPIQLTGYDNYKLVGELIGQDLTVIPELMEQPRYALEATIAWWEDRIPDSAIGDPEKVTKRVQGGLLGLAERQHLSNLAERALA
jgi:putative chitinase